jgi:hypothetical protein
MIDYGFILDGRVHMHGLGTMVGFACFLLWRKGRDKNQHQGPSDTGCFFQYTMKHPCNFILHWSAAVLRG